MDTAAPSLFSRLGDAARVAARRRRLALALYLPSLLLGLLATIPIFLVGENLARLGPWTARLAAGDFLNMLSEVALLGRAEGVPPEARLAAANYTWAIVLLPLGILLQGLLYNLLSGAVLEGLAGQTPDSFGDALRRWAWPSLWFGLLALPLYLVLAAAGLWLVVWLPLGDVISWPRLLPAVAWLAYLDGMLELARADMVARGDRRALRSLGRTLALASRPGLLLRCAGVWLLLGLASVAFSLLNGNVIPGLPPVWPLLLLATQALALAGAWLKLLRLSVALPLARAAGQSPS